jgi:hypothetical protein
MFCNVGSLTGRWGGMVGEIDYAAANEALARLGMWASRHTAFPVKTLCWPTWERLGMIKNFDVAVNYSSALAVAEGVNRWQRELVSARSGEVMFMGALGNLGSPAYLKGFPPAEATANIESLYTQYHYLGDVVRFMPGRELVTRHGISSASAPALYEFEVGGVGALPVSILLDYAIAAGEWLRPAGPHVALQEIREIAVNLPALRVEGAQYAFARCAVSSSDASTGKVVVTFTKADHSGPIASLELVYGEARESNVLAVRSDADSRDADLPPAPGLRWPGVHLKLARWRETPDGRVVGTAGSCRASDLWSTLRVPASTLPFAGLENILRAASARGRGSGLRISRLVPGAGSQADLGISGHPADGRWNAVDPEGRVVVQVEGLVFTAADERLADERLVAGEGHRADSRSRVSA